MLLKDWAVRLNDGRILIVLENERQHAPYRPLSSVLVFIDPFAFAFERQRSRKRDPP